MKSTRYAFTSAKGVDVKRPGSCRDLVLLVRAGDDRVFIETNFNFLFINIIASTMDTIKTGGVSDIPLKQRAQHVSGETYIYK